MPVVGSFGVKIGFEQASPRVYRPRKGVASLRYICIQVAYFNSQQSGRNLLLHLDISSPTRHYGNGWDDFNAIEKFCVWLTARARYLMHSTGRIYHLYSYFAIFCRVGKYNQMRLSIYYHVYEKEKRYLLSRMVSKIFIFFTQNILELFHISCGLRLRVQLYRELYTSTHWSSISCTQ